VIEKIRKFGNTIQNIARWVDYIGSCFVNLPDFSIGKKEDARQGDSAAN
jgi:hypothetical protein